MSSLLECSGSRQELLEEGGEAVGGRRLTCEEMEDSCGDGRVEAATGTCTEPNQSSKAHEAEADKGQEKLQSPEICRLKTQDRFLKDVLKTDLLPSGYISTHSNSLA